ncbi:hypothetical protein SteCoe_18627 [Stentor coeruleus]|uniref:Peptidase A1 domain-containing protein n=1 Tax=Stentor coeruleus TaxID=5963 RepID=A0A1R2BW11_9CILI|nr:hypothetical protein SteCoe_18627 [Stentor coeruleus]
MAFILLVLPLVLSLSTRSLPIRKPSLNLKDFSTVQNPENYMKNLNLLEDTQIDSDSKYITVKISVGNPSISVLTNIFFSDEYVIIPIKDEDHPSGYNMSASSTLKDVQSGINWGDIKGYMANEQVSFANFTLESQAVILANYSSRSTNNNGILGLKFTSSEINNNFIYNLYKAGKISYPVFSINLQDKEFTINNPSAEKYEKNTNFTAICSEFWAMNLSVLDSKGKKGSFYNVYLKPESEFIYGTKDKVEEYYQKVNKTGSCQEDGDAVVCDCQESDIENYQGIEFEDANGNKLSLSSKSFVDYKDGKCTFYLSAKTYGRWEIGQAVFKEYHAIFNVFTGEVVLHSFGEVSSSSFFLYVILGIVIVILLGGVALVCSKKGSKDYSKLH